MFLKIILNLRAFKTRLGKTLHTFPSFHLSGVTSPMITQGIGSWKVEMNRERFKCPLISNFTIGNILALIKR